MISFTIPGQPITKKNSMQIITNRLTGRPQIIPSKQYKQYLKDCKLFMPAIDTIDSPINLQTIYYMQTRRKVDLTNLMAATHDILTHYKVIADDNISIIVGVDGSRVNHDKENPRVEVVIKWML